MTLVCVKVSNIRPKYDNLKEWIEDPNNVYIGRGGIVFINNERYPKKDSKWANPFTVKKYGLDMAIKKYKEYILEKINSGEITIDDLRKIKGKNLGCWCKEGDPCHGKIILKILNCISS